MIKEITIYEVNGVRFDKLNDAAKYEDLCDEIERIMSRLKPRSAPRIGSTTHRIITYARSYFTHT